MIGKLHEQSREPCILPLQLDKIKFTKHHQVFYIQYFKRKHSASCVFLSKL